MFRRCNTRFSIMGVGCKGSGKSSFFNNIVGKEVIKTKESKEIDIYMLCIDCEGLVHNITFIDTPGLGNNIDDNGLQGSIIDYIKEQFDSYIEEETKVRRNPKYEDSRVNVMLYFIPSTSYGLKQSDIEFLKKACKLVNIIPIISKADGLNLNETENFKKLVQKQLKYYNISVFDLGNSDYVAESIVDLQLNSHIPFTSIGVDNSDDGCRLRKYGESVIEVDNPKHSDLSILREILLSSHMSALMESTNGELYENYRSEALEAVLEE